MHPVSETEALNGEDRDLPVPSRGNSDDKGELAPISCSRSSEEEIGSGCDGPVESEQWFEADELYWLDCDSGDDGEEWFDAEEELWFDCRRRLKVHESKPKSSVKAVPVKREPKPKAPIVITSFPSVLMLLSYVMISMYNVGMRLRLLGVTKDPVEAQWKERIVALYERLKLYWWPPPEQNEIVRNKAHHKKMLLTALAIAMMKADAAAPPIYLSEDFAFRQEIRRASRHGVLNTAKLSPEGAAYVRKAVDGMPAWLFQPGDSHYILVDSGCSDSCTGDKEDLIPETVEALEKPRPMDGVGGTLMATHRGKFRYEILADDGTVQALEGHQYYVPGLPCKLFGPQDYFGQKHAEGLEGYSLNVTWSGSTLQLGPNVTVSIPHDRMTRLPKLRCYKKVMETAESMANLCVTDELNQNLTELQKALLKAHWRLGHVGFQWLQWIGRQGRLGKTGELFGVSSTQCPKCAACQFGKQERNPKAGSKTKVDEQREGILKADNLKPGELIFSDQYVSSTPGRVFGRRGASISSQKYCGGTLFVDAATL